MALVQDHVITSLIEKRAKLNELNEPQIEAVKEAIVEAIDLGSKIGVADAVIKTSESFNSIIQKLVLARTFLASMSALVVGVALSYRVHNPGWLIVLTGLANTAAYYVIDLFAMAFRRLLRPKGKTNDSAGSQTGDQSS